MRHRIEKLTWRLSHSLTVVGHSLGGRTCPPSLDFLANKGEGYLEVIRVARIVTLPGNAAPPNWKHLISVIDFDEE